MDRTGQSGCAHWIFCVSQDQRLELFRLMAVEDSRISGEQPSPYLPRPARSQQGKVPAEGGEGACPWYRVTNHPKMYI
ncbi:hypothetical protein FJTKL_09983 [Diaporthe vaccinii]|uniref:Uncharacterized protein n=1 Tax=Diaporthe vaccinii TaxID=105482 RepID=A0ABR4EM11_9PEZI